MSHDKAFIACEPAYRDRLQSLGWVGDQASCCEVYFMAGPALAGEHVKSTAESLRCPQEDGGGGGGAAPWRCAVLQLRGAYLGTLVIVVSTLRLAPSPSSVLLTSHSDLEKVSSLSVHTYIMCRYERSMHGEIPHQTNSFQLGNRWPHGAEGLADRGGPRAAQSRGPSLAGGRLV